MRTWEENKRAINELWSQCQWTEEERRLMHDDLGGLDQVVLYDAIRNVKRSHDSLYPQLKWFLEEHRSLARIRKLASARPAAEKRETVVIDSELDTRIRDELTAVVEMATPETFEETRDLIADKASKLQIELATAFRLCMYLLKRLGLDEGNVFGGYT